MVAVGEYLRKGALLQAGVMRACSPLMLLNLTSTLFLIIHQP